MGVIHHLSPFYFLPLLPPLPPLSFPFQDIRGGSPGLRALVGTAVLGGLGGLGVRWVPLAFEFAMETPGL